MIARTPNQHENNFPNKVKASQEQILGSEGRNESKRAGQWESQSRIWIGKLRIWVKTFKMEKL